LDEVVEFSAKISPFEREYWITRPDFRIRLVIPGIQPVSWIPGATIEGISDPVDRRRSISYQFNKASVSSSACRVGWPESEPDTKSLGWVANGFCMANYNIGVRFKLRMRYAEVSSYYQALITNPVIKVE